jgi:hypothetical protein
MILPFSTQMNGKPTMFTNKIVKSMWQHYPLQMKELALSRKLPEHYVFEDLTVFKEEELNPKLHTIREDKTDRWHIGTKIDFFINCRQPTMFRFAPVLPVVSVQKVEIKWISMTKPLGERRPWVRIDGKNIFTIEHFITEEMTQLALNDGFDNVQDFFAYFKEDFKGKIIHWTDLKY